MRALFVSSIQRHWSWVVVGAMFGLLQGAIAQNLQLDNVIQVGKEGGEAHGTAIVLGNDGSTCITGYFSGLVDFDPGQGTADRTSAGDFDGFVVKLDADRNLLWVKTFGGLYEEKSNAIAIDSDGNVCITGTVERTSASEDPDKSAGIDDSDKGNFPPLAVDLFVTKLDRAGEELWTRRFSPSGYQDAEGWGIAVDPADNVLLTGNFGGTMDLDPGSGAQIVDASYSTDLFVIELDPSGEFVWARTTGTVENDDVSGRDIAVDTSGNVYTVGWFLGEADFDPGDPVALFESAGGRDVFIQKLDSEGSFVWARTFGGASNDSGLGIAIDFTGAVCTTGWFQGPVDFDPGFGETILTSAGTVSGLDRPLDTLFVQRLNSDGSFDWARVASASGDSDDAGYNQGNDIESDGAGNLYVIGKFDGAIDLDPGEGTYDVSSDYMDRVFVQKLNRYGEFQWAWQPGQFYQAGRLDPKGMGAGDHGITVDPEGNAQITGDFVGFLDFDPGEEEHSLNGNTSDNVFVTRLDPLGNYSGAARMGARYEPVFANDIAADADGNTYTTGAWLKGIEPELYVYEHPHGLHTRSTAFISKHAPSGELAWTQELSGDGFESGEEVALDGEGNIYQAGYFAGTVDFDSGPGVLEITSTYEVDYFVRKIDTDGNLIWVRPLAGEDKHYSTRPQLRETHGLGLAVDDWGFVYVTGAFQGEVDFDPGVRVHNLTAKGDNDAFVVKVSPLGNLVWARSMGGDRRTAGADIGVDSEGSVYTVGHFSGAIDFDPGVWWHMQVSSGEMDFYVHKLNEDGEFQWVRRIGGEASLGEFVNDMVVDCIGNVHIAGYARGEVDLDPGLGVVTLEAWSESRAFVQKLDKEGRLDWVQPVDMFESEWVSALAVDGAGGVYAIGDFYGDIDIDPGPDIQTAFRYGVSLHKLEADGDVDWSSRIATSNSYTSGTQVVVDRLGILHLAASAWGDLVFDAGGETSSLTVTGGADMVVARLNQRNYEAVDDRCPSLPGAEDAILQSIAVTLNRVFGLIDLDSSGSLTWEEIVAEIPGISQQHVEAIDASGDGLLVQGELGSFLPAGEGEGEGPIPGCPLNASNMAKHISDALGDILLFGLSAIVLMIIGGRRKVL